MFQTIVHQTLEDRDNVDHIENHGPFPVGNIKKSYLGSGYYFWDDHIELAHWWGKNYIKAQYVICEGSLKVPLESFYDLVGCRQDQKHFKASIEKFKLHHLSIGKIIEFLKDMENLPGKKGTFPFKVIRAMDVGKNSFVQQYKEFASGKIGRANLTPQMIICLIEKNKLFLPAYKVVFPETYI